ncbi:MAG TPA: hypothetical protein DCS93_07295 [Microscillaceae bacterium]|nr:hypothetical protein [Microscillaceae bacterium]
MLFLFSISLVQGQMLKRKIELRKSPTGAVIDTLTSWQYNREGKLVSRLRHQEAFQVNYQYDKQGRLTIEEGLATSYFEKKYTYTNLKKCEYQKTANYSYTTCDSTNKQGQVIYTYRVRTEFPDHPEFTRTIHRAYFLYKKGLRLGEQQETVEQRGNLDDTTSWTTQNKLQRYRFYHYNSEDSLVYVLGVIPNSFSMADLENLLKKYDGLRQKRAWSRLEQWIQEKIKQKVFRVYQHCTYQTKTGLKLTETHYNRLGEMLEFTRYHYNDAGKLIEKHHRHQRWPNKIQYKTKFFYNSRGLLSKHIYQESEQGKLSKEVIKKYEQNRLKSEAFRSFPGTQVLSSYKEYHYEFWN